ncbi:MAG: clan AA aspartic protease [Janthinobacterium lividum]
MITGIVRNRRVFVELAVAEPDGQMVSVKFVLDSGFTGVTTLAPEACSTLDLPLLRLQPTSLADGSPLLLEVYQATLLWNGEEREVEVLALEGEPLIGMTLLEDSDVRFQGNEGGIVSIKPL